MDSSSRVIPEWDEHSGPRNGTERVKLSIYPQRLEVVVAVAAAVAGGMRGMVTTSLDELTSTSEAKEAILSACVAFLLRQP